MSVSGLAHGSGRRVTGARSKAEPLQGAQAGSANLLIQENMGFLFEANELGSCFGFVT